MDYLSVNEKYGPEHTPITLADLQRRNPTGKFEIMHFRNGKKYIIERISPTPGDIRIVAEENPFRQARKPQHLKTPTPPVVTEQAYPASRFLDWRR